MTENRDVAAGDRGEFLVVRNDEDQYSVWPALEQLPSGWAALGEPQPLSACLDFIAATWTDLRPASLRRLLDQRRG